MRNNPKLSVKFSLVFLVSVFFICNNCDFNKSFTLNTKYNPLGNNWLVGSIMQARTHGVFHSSVFTSRFIPQHTKNSLKYRSLYRKMQYQTDLYLTGEEITIPGTWNVYKSAIRLPVTLWVLIDQAYYKITGTYGLLFEEYTYTVNLLNSITFALLILWLYQEFGIIAAAASVMYLLLSPIINNSYLESPIFWHSIPLIASLFFFRWILNTDKISMVKIFLFSFVVLFIRQLTSYEFTPIVVFGVYAAIIYYILKYKITRVPAFKILLISTSGMMTGIVLVIGLHLILLAEYQHSLERAIGWFSQKFIQRSYAEIGDIANAAIHKESEGTKKSLGLVLKKYFLNKDLIFGLNTLGVIFIQAFLIFASYIMARLGKVSEVEFNNVLRLFVFSLLVLSGVFSYFVVFKSQAFDHNFPSIFFDTSFYFLALSASIALAIQILVTSLLPHNKTDHRA